MTIERRFVPSVDQERLVRAWDTVVQNNPIFRTRMVETSAEGYLQVVLRDVVPLESRPMRYLKIHQSPTIYGDSIGNSYDW